MRIAVLIPGLLVLASCAHFQDVRPGKNGLHSVVITGQDEDDAAREALAQAGHYCKEKFKKEVVIVSENKKYIGEMDEQSYKNTRKAADVAKAVGGSGDAIGLGGMGASAYIGKGYRVEMTFNCK